MWTRQPERLEDVCAALYYSGADDKRERAGLSSLPVVWVRELESDFIVKELTSSEVMCGEFFGLRLAIRVS